MRKILMAMVLLAPFAAHATDVRFTNTNILSSNSNSHAAALAAATARATAGAIATGGSATSSARGGRASANGTVTTTVTGERDRLQAPSLGGLMAAASGPCVGATVTGQLSFAGFGAGGGASTIEGECQIREAARILNALGETHVATLLVLSLPSVKAALEGPQATVPPRVASTPQPAPVVAQTPIRATGRTAMSGFSFN